MTRKTWWVWLPLIVGAVLAVVLAATLGDRRVYVSVAPWLPALLAGVVGSAVALAGVVTSARRHRRQIELLDRTRAQATKARRRFVQRLDHELKNPLTALFAALSGDGVSAQRGLDQRARLGALAQADRLRRLLTDLRRVADVETVAMDVAPVDIGRLVQEAVAWAVADAGGTRQVRVDVPSAPRPLPVVAGDGDLLGLAVYNVIANALKYTVPGDAVEVRARAVDGRRPAVVVEVADAGPGVGPDELEVVWEELARGRSAAGHPGSGIGLALVRAVVERHGGAVTMSSRPGDGTSVYLMLSVDNGPLRLGSDPTLRGGLPR